MKKAITVILLCASMLWANAQRPSFIMLTNPLNNARNSLDVSVQIQTPQLPKWAVVGAFCYQTSKKTVEDFDVSSESQTRGFSVKYFPFEKQIFSLKKKKFYPEVNNRKRREGCYGFKKEEPLTHKLLRGSYFSIGYEYRTAALLFVPQKVINDPTKLQLKLSNKAIVLGVGWQIQVSKLLLGAGYRLSVGKPQVEGADLNIQKELYSNTFPVAFRLEHGLHLDIGLCF